MCFGTTHVLSCRHKLRHISYRCSQGCGVLRGRVYYLEDCCAACDPEARISRIERKYRAQHEKLSQKLVQQQVAVTPAQVAETEHSIRELQLFMMKQISVVRRQGIYSAVEVAFPWSNNMVQQGLDSEWVNGKCVWSRELPANGTRRRPAQVPADWVVREVPTIQPEEPDLEEDESGDEGTERDGGEVETPEPPPADNKGVFIRLADAKGDDGCELPNGVANDDEDIWLKIADELSDPGRTNGPLRPSPMARFYPKGKKL